MPSVRYILITVQFFLLVPACADVALLQNGTVLVNVHVDDRRGTETQPLRVRFFENSFEYRPRSDSVHLLEGYSKVLPVANVLSTSTVYAKESVRKLVDEQKWKAYVPPPRRVVTLPEREPAQPTPEPGQNSPPAPVLVNVIPPSVPLDVRLQRQVDLFLREQKLLADTLATSVTIGQLTAEQAVWHRLYLLENQKLVLHRFFPPTSEVTGTLSQWDEMTTEVTKIRRFPFEI